MFGQVVVGPPGSGKTTYCAGMREFLEKLDRTTVCVNLDPANDTELPYVCEINISTLIKVTDVMERLSLGPNGALIFCMEYLDAHSDWLKKELDALPTHSYIFFDFPGQVELFTHHKSVHNILRKLQEWDHRIVSVNLSDSLYCTEPSKFVSVALLSLLTMIQLETPHLNVLSKADLIGSVARLPFSVDYFTEVMDLSHLVQLLDDDPFLKNFKKLNKSLADVIQDYNLVNFLLLDVTKKESMLAVLTAADQANGFAFYENDAPNLPNMTEDHAARRAR